MGLYRYKKRFGRWSDWGHFRYNVRNGNGSVTHNGAVIFRCRCANFGELSAAFETAILTEKR